MTVGASTGCVGGNTLGFKTPTLTPHIPCLPLPTFSFSFGFALPTFDFAFILQIPKLFLHLKLSCNLENPIDLTGGVVLPFGGGRIAACDGDTDALQAAA